MWHIIVTICFLSLTEIPHACFPNAYFPQKFATEEECRQGVYSMVKILHEDFKEMKVQAYFDCINKRPLTLPPVFPEGTNASENFLSVKYEDLRVKFEELSK